MANLAKGQVVRGGYSKSKGTKITKFARPNIKAKQTNSDFWLKSLGPLGAVSNKSRMLMKPRLT